MKFGSERTKADLEARLATLPYWGQQPDKMSLNGYGCQTCHKQIMVVHMDRGTTPMFMGCKATDGCDGRMDSFGYPTQPPPKDWHKVVRVYEWYRPETNALGMFHEDQIVDEYIRQGGLLLRERIKNG